MTPETPSLEPKVRKRRMHGKSAAGGGAYFLAFVGALVYYMQHADSFWMGVLGVLKAIVWPMLLIHKLFGYLNM